MRSKRVRSLGAATATAALALLVLMLSPCGVRADDEYAPSPEVCKVFVCALSFHPRAGGTFWAHFGFDAPAARPAIKMKAFERNEEAFHSRRRRSDIVPGVGARAQVPTVCRGRQKSHQRRPRHTATTIALFGFGFLVFHFSLSEAPIAALQH